MLQVLLLITLDTFFPYSFSHYNELPVINAAIVVAAKAIHFKIFTILSPVGDFCVIINLIFINNCITLQIYIIILKMQVFSVLIGIIVEL